MTATGSFSRDPWTLQDNVRAIGTGGRRELHADRRDPPARRHRLRAGRVARHVALVPARRAAAGDHRRLLRAGQDRLAAMRAGRRGWLAPSAGVLARRPRRCSARDRCARCFSGCSVRWWSPSELGPDRADVPAESPALTAVMIAAFAGKMVFFGAYVAVVLRGLSLRPVPFVASFTALLHRASI